MKTIFFGLSSDTFWTRCNCKMSTKSFKVIRLKDTQLAEKYIIRKPPNLSPRVKNYRHPADVENCPQLHNSLARSFARKLTSIWARGPIGTNCCGSVVAPSAKPER